MIIIGFSTKTSRIMPRVFCRRFKHCAIIIQQKNKMFLYQFVRCGHTEIIEINNKGINTLAKFGWIFVYLPQNIHTDFNWRHAKTCVDLAKRAIRLKQFDIQTPDALYRYLIGV